MKVYQRKLYDSTGREIGSTLTAVVETIGERQKKTVIENRLIDYASDKLYPSYKGLAFHRYQDKETDTAAIAVLLLLETTDYREIEI